MRLFLRAHGPGLPGLRVKQPRLLQDLTAIFDQVDLSADFILDSLTDKTERVDVLDLTARPKLTARSPHGNVDVATHGALLHVAITRAQIAHNRPQLLEERLRFLRGPHVGL